jgi:hypothetical protein
MMTQNGGRREMEAGGVREKGRRTGRTFLMQLNAWFQ